MTNATMALTELAKKGADNDVLRQMGQFMALCLMEFDVEARCGLGHDEKKPGERLNSRNGYRDRIWETRVGPEELRIPQAAPRQLSPRAPGTPAHRREALATVIQEVYVQSICTRPVDKLVKALGMSGISKSDCAPSSRSA